MASRDLFRALEIPDYRLLFFGSLAASFAMNMQIMARGWLVYQLTGSEMDLSYVTLSFMIPTVLFSLWGGVLADSYPKRPLIVIGQTLNALATLAMAIIIYTERVTFSDFIWFGFFNGTVLALSMPARQAFVPELVPDRLILTATSLNTSGWNFARIVGPALAGMLIAFVADGDERSYFGVAVVYFVMFSLYLVSAVSMGLLSRRGEVHPRNGNALGEVLGAFRYIRANPPVLGLLVLSVIPFLFGMPLNTLLPAFNHDILGGGADDLGYLISAMGTGAIIGSLYTAGLEGLKRKGFWVVVTCIGWGLATSAFGLAGSVVIGLIAILVVGLLSSVNSSLNRGVLQVQVEPAMRGKILSIDMMSHGLMPLGLMPISYIAETWGVSVALVASGAFFVLLVLLSMVLVPAVKHILRSV
ncbi:MAG: MFS transporter [Pseudomonadales bacterium]|nr:MFS transporter [Pseudomonadales bacterium]